MLSWKALLRENFHRELFCRVKQVSQNLQIGMQSRPALSNLSIQSGRVGACVFAKPPKR